MASHPALVKSSKLIMALEEKYVTEERVVKRIIGKIVLDLTPRADQCVKITYHQVERWYR